MPEPSLSGVSHAKGGLCWRRIAHILLSRSTLACVRRADLLAAERRAARGAADRRAAPLKLLARAGAVTWPKQAARSATACGPTSGDR